MSIVADGNAGSYIRWNTGLPSAADPITVCIWLRLISDLNAAGVIFQLSDGASGYLGLFTASDGTHINILTSAGNSANSTIELDTTNWFHLAYVRNGSSHQLYINGTTDVSFTGNPSFTPAYALLFSNGGNPINARMDGIKIWDAALTLNEILQEVWVKRPVRTANLRVCMPCFSGSTERLKDISGVSTFIDGGSGISDGDPWCISYGEDSYLLPSTTWSIRPTGTLITVGTLVKRLSKSLASTLTTAGALTKKFQHSLSGTLTTTSTLIRTHIKTLVGILTTTGNITQKAIIHLLNSTLTTSNTITKVLSRTLVGTLTSASLLTINKTTALVVTGMLTTASTLIRTIQHTISGTLTTASILVKHVTKSFNGILTTESTLSDLLLRTVNLVGTLITASILTKTNNKILNSTVTTVGTLARSMTHSLSGILSTASTLTILRTVLVSLTGTLNTTSSLLRTSLKTLSSTLTSQNTLNKQFQTLFESDLFSNASIRSIVNKYLIGTLTTTSTLTKLQYLLLNGVLSTSSSIRKLIGKALNSLLTLASSLVINSTSNTTPNIATLTLSDAPALKVTVGTSSLYSISVNDAQALRSVNAIAEQTQVVLTDR